MIGVAGGAEKCRLALANGYAFAIDRGREDIAARVREITGGAGVPVAYDSVGRTTFETTLECLAPRGFFVSFGAISGAPPAVEASRLREAGSLYFTRPALATYTATRAELEASAAAVFALAGRGRAQAAHPRRATHSPMRREPTPTSRQAAPSAPRFSSPDRTRHMNDLLIRGATVYDGTGAPGRVAEVAVKDGRIAAPGPARETIDAGGLALMPGIVDVHTHYDAQVTWDPTLSPSPVARRHHRGDGQLRLRHRAVPGRRCARRCSRTSRWSRAWTSTRCSPARAGSSSPSPSTSTRCERVAALRQRRRARRALDDPHRGDGRGRVARARSPRPRSCARMQAHGARGARRRRDRLRLVLLAEPQRLGRPADAVDDRDRRGAARARRAAGEAGARRSSSSPTGPRATPEYHGGDRRRHRPADVHGDGAHHVQRRGARSAR